MPLRADISQYCALKFAIKQLLGNQAWLDLKECTSLSTWRAYVLKLIKAVRVSIEESVEVRDQMWMDAVIDNLKRGTESVKSSKDIDSLLSGFSATLLRQVFLQIGTIPNHQSARRVTLRRETWRLNYHCSVQSLAQVEAVFWSEQQRRIGIERQMELHYEYRVSKSKLPFSQWCRERGGLTLW